MESKLPPRVTVVITSRNRLAEVTQAVPSCLAQAEPCEILVYDDASTEHTVEDLKSRFPSIRVIRSEERVGLICVRNRGFREALGDIVVSIDDDAFFSTPDTLSQVLARISRYPQAAAFALAYVEPYADREKLPPLPEGTKVRGYVGCAHAIYRAAALTLGGYPELLVHQGEERDHAIRLIDEGQDIVYLDTPPIVHLYSPKRDLPRISFYGYRNTLLFAWMRLPFPECVIRAVVGSAQLMFYRFTWSSAWACIPSLAAGWWGLIHFRQHRKPVSRAAFRKYRCLPSHDLLILSEAENLRYQRLSESKLIETRKSTATAPQAVEEQNPR